MSNDLIIPFFILSLYVHDILLVGNDIAMVVDTKNRLSLNCEMKGMVKQVLYRSQNSEGSFKKTSWFVLGDLH